MKASSCLALPLMKIKVLFIKNRITYSIVQDIEKYKQWLITLGLEPEFEFKETDLDLKFKDFKVGGWWGLDGIKQQIRELFIVPPLKYDIVIFCYDDPSIVRNLANWTYPNPLNGSAFVEVVYTPKFVGLNGDVLVHESTHAFGRILMWKGIYIVDYLDQGIDMIPFYKPYFSLMLKEFTPEKKVGIFAEFVGFLRTMVDLLIKKKEKE